MNSLSFFRFLSLLIPAAASPALAAAPPAHGTELQPLKDPTLPSLHVKTPAFRDILDVVRETASAGQEAIAPVLQNLRRKFPDYFNYYVLNYDSRSLQGSTRAHPRVILHGDGRTFLSFNGDPAARGFSTLEMIEFKGADGYEFHSFNFTKEPGALHLQGEDVETSVGSVQVSRANPRLCQSCHGVASPRPIFDAYVVWPGFYGGDDDGLFLYGRAKSDYVSFQGPDLETPAWKTLRSTFRQHPRYQFLEGALASHRLIRDPAKDRINLNFNKILSYQMAAPLLLGLERNEEALEVLAAVDRCRNLLPTELFSANRARLVALLSVQQSLFEQAVGSRVSIAPGATEFMTGDRFASRMTGFERALWKYAGKNLREHSYSRMRDLDLQDGGGGLRYLGSMARDLLKRNFGHDVDYGNCARILKRIE